MKFCLSHFISLCFYKKRSREKENWRYIRIIMKIYKIMREVGYGQITHGLSCWIDMFGFPYPFFFLSLFFWLSQIPYAISVILDWTEFCGYSVNVITVFCEKINCNFQITNWQSNLCNILVFYDLSFCQCYLTFLLLSNFWFVK